MFQRTFQPVDPLFQVSGEASSVWQVTAASWGFAAGPALASAAGSMESLRWVKEFNNKTGCNTLARHSRRGRVSSWIALETFLSCPKGQQLD